MTAPTAGLDLAHRWRAHANDDCTGINTVFAVCGVTSPLGRLLERHINQIHAVLLDDFAADHGASRPDSGRAPNRSRPRSPSAAGMIRHGLHRGLDRRRVAMTAAVHAALTALLRERRALLIEIADFWSDKGGKPGSLAASARQRVQRHLRATNRALELLNDCADDLVDAA